MHISRITLLLLALTWAAGAVPTGLFSWNQYHVLRDLREENRQWRQTALSELRMVESQVRMLQDLRVKELDVTAYSAEREQTDEDPLITASMRRVRPGTVAVSRDLFQQGWVFGRKVYIEGHGVFEINDLMNERFTSRLDVFMPETSLAQEFGRKTLTVALLDV